MDGFGLPDAVAVIAASAAILAVLISYLLALTQYLSSRYTPLLIPVFLRRLDTRRRRYVVAVLAVCLVLSLLPPSVRIGPIPADTIAALLTTGFLIAFFGWLFVIMYQLLVESMNSVRVIGWLEVEGPEVRQTALREIIVPALARMDLAAINAAFAAAVAHGVDDEVAVLATLLAQRRSIGAAWIAPSLLDELLSSLDSTSLERRRAVIEALLSESLRAGLSGVAVVTLERVFNVLRAARPWQRIHSEVVAALSDIVWEVRPSDETLPHHPWLERPHAEPEGKLVGQLAWIQQDVCRPDGAARDWPLSLLEYCQVLHWVTSNVLNPTYLGQLLRFYEQIIYFCPRNRLLEGSVVQELCYGLASARTCVYRGTQRGDAQEWIGAKQRIHEAAVDLAAVIANANKPMLLTKALQSAVFMLGIEYIALKTEIIPIEGYDELADRWHMMRFSERQHKQRIGEPVPDPPPHIVTVTGITRPPLKIAGEVWPSN